MKTKKLVDTIYDIQTGDISFTDALLIASTPKEFVILNKAKTICTDYPIQALKRIPVNHTLSEARNVQIINAKEYQEYILNPNL